MFDLGDPVPLAVTVYNNATPPAPANAGNVAVTITGPTTANTIDPVAPSATGVYTYTFTPTEPGRHVVRWVATGANASAYTDVFDVDDAATADLVSLADARAHLGFNTSTIDDEELRSFISAASKYLENRYGPLARHTYTETRTPSRTGLLLSHYPVISLTSVAGAYGYTAPNTDVSTLHVTDAGMLCSNYGAAWLGCYPLTVTYVAGLTTMPADVQKACLEIVAGLWESQRGGGSGGSPEALLQGAGEGEFVSGMGLTYYRAEKLMEPYRKPVVA